MFNEKILDYVNKLVKYSEKEKINWYYNSDESSVSATVKDNKINIIYFFDENRELGCYRLEIKSNSNEAAYNVWDGERGYDQCRKLLDIGSSSNFDLTLTDDDFNNRFLGK